MLARYAAAAGLDHNMPPHRLRHFLFTWLKTQGIDDALIQPYGGHGHRQSFEIYSRLSLADAQPVYDDAIRSRLLGGSGHVREYHALTRRGATPLIDSPARSPFVRSLLLLS